MYSDVRLDRCAVVVRLEKPEKPVAQPCEACCLPGERQALHALLAPLALRSAQGGGAAGAPWSAAAGLVARAGRGMTGG